jgi:hypothetical protein
MIVVMIIVIDNSKWLIGDCDYLTIVIIWIYEW